MSDERHENGKELFKVGEDESTEAQKDVSAPTVSDDAADESVSEAATPTEPVATSVEPEAAPVVTTDGDDGFSALQPRRDLVADTSREPL